ncbi:MAG: hypothetical protein SGARI_003033 [Bacillariaceae sp.]
MKLFLSTFFLLACFFQATAAQEQGLRGLRPVENPGQGNAHGLGRKEYIVILKNEGPGSDVKGRANTIVAGIPGGSRHFTYEKIFQGFSFSLPATAADAAVNALLRRFDIEAVAENESMEILSQEPSWGFTHVKAHENLNLGFDANGNGDVDVDIAVLDTGIDLDHEDLNVFETVDCVTGDSCQEGIGGDDRGHGTKVAGEYTKSARRSRRLGRKTHAFFIVSFSTRREGIVGARNNVLGRIGIAPGARLWNVKLEWSTF